MEPAKRFGRNLRVKRVAKGMSQEALGHSCNLHPTEISRLERAVREPRLSTIVRLARALDTTAANLLEGIR